MFDKPPELSPDVKWLLESGQEKDGVLIAALVDEYYARILRFVSSDFEDVRLARQTAKEVLAIAVTERHRFSGEEDLEDWLLGLARQACRRHRRRDFDRARLEQACVPGETRALLEVAESEAGDIQGEIQVLVAEKRRIRRRSARTQEFLILGLAILLVAAVLGMANRLLADADYFVANEADATAFRKLRLEATQTGLASQGIRVTSTPVTPVPPLEALTLNSDSDAIRWRLAQTPDLFNTLWVEGLLYNYGPAGYAGPPLARRFQAWLSKGVHVLVASGPIEGEPDNFVSSPNANLGNSFGGQDPYLLNLISREFPWLQMGISSPSIIQTAYTSFASRSDPGNEFPAVAKAVVAGRQALIVDQVNAAGEREARLWVDVITGKVLREQHFGGADRGTVISEAVVTGVAYDVEIPEQVIALWDESRPLVENQPGESWLPAPEGVSSMDPPAEIPVVRPVLPKVSPPPGFDPSRSRLTFQSAGAALGDESSQGSVDLFADGFFLGNLGMKSPLAIVQCRRSSDGSQIAYLELSGGNQVTAPLRWFDLRDPENLHTSLSIAAIRNFAFSPDGRRIAVLGMGTPPPEAFKFPRGVFILDASTGERLQAIESEMAILVSWSLDGNHLIGLRTNRPSRRTFTVVAVDTDSEEGLQGTITFTRWGASGEVNVGYAFPELQIEGVYGGFNKGLEECVEP